MPSRYRAVLQLAAFGSLLLLANIRASGIERELRYSANFESHSEVEDEASSILSLSLRETRIWERYRNEYDLTFTYNYEHRENEDNEQYSGFYFGSYEVAGPDFVWDLRGDFEVLAEESGAEIDTFSSQNLTTLSTGPKLRLFPALRGETELSALLSRSDYSESNLDSRQGDVALRHRYPINNRRSLTFETFYQTVEFVDEINAINEYDANGLAIEFDARGPRSTFGLRAAVIEFDNELDTPNQEEYGLRYGYQLTPRGTLTFALEDTIETAAEFNRANPTDTNAIFIASPIRTERATLGYAYLDIEDTFDFSIYVEDVEILFEDTSAEEITGITFGWVRRISEGWTFLLEADTAENDFLDSQTDSLTTSLIYTRRHGPRTVSELEFSVEADEVDDERIEDRIVAYRFVASLIK